MLNLYFQGQGIQRNYQISARENGKTSTQAVISFTSTQAVDNKIYTGSQWNQTYTITEYAI